MATFKATKEQLNMYGCADCAKHVIVLVAGTSDAVNAFINNTHFLTDGHRANSYDSQAAYWDPAFKNAVNLLENPTDTSGPMILMDQHGWSGDNKIEQRLIAGRYLVDMLCGEAPLQNGINQYVKPYRKRPVFFHLIGHSHGGNVINEMTRRIDAMGDLWPEPWKVKSITYLSTPFFNELHQVKATPKVFHEDAEILHLYNEYDLTQRMLADFSLEQLAETIHSIDTSVFEKHINVLIPPKESDRFEASDFYFIWPSFEEGKRVYDNYLKVFRAVRGIVEGAIEIVDKLSKPITHSISKEDAKYLDKKTTPDTRTIISKKVKDLLIYDIRKRKEKKKEGILIKIRNEIDKNINLFEDRNQLHANGNTSYRVANLYKDLQINDLVEILTDFLDVDRKTMLSKKENGLVNIIIEIALSNIQAFDNTYVDPSPQFKDSFLSAKVTALNITDRDPFDKMEPYSDNFKVFMEHINKIETNFPKDNKTNAADLLFTLAQNSTIVAYYLGEMSFWGKVIRGFAETIRANRWREKVGDLWIGDHDPSNLERRLFALAAAISNSQAILSTKDFGGLEEEYTPPSEEQATRTEAHEASLEANKERREQAKAQREKEAKKASIEEEKEKRVLGPSLKKAEKAQQEYIEAIQQPGLSPQQVQSIAQKWVESSDAKLLQEHSKKTREREIAKQKREKADKQYEKDKKEYDDYAKERAKFSVGSLPYLFIESHSVSRRVLHGEVKAFLRRMGPKKR